MTKVNQVLLQRNLTREGIEVHRILYRSSGLQRLYSQIGQRSVQVKPDPRDITRIYVWHPYRSIWIEVSLPKIKRSVWKRKVDRIASNFYSQNSK
jgi:hypothetical protein